MGFFGRRQGFLPDDVLAALQRVEADVCRQRMAELERAHAPVDRSKPIRLHPEATLFHRFGTGALMTGWRFRFPDGRIEVRWEAGMPAHPSVEMWPQNGELVS